MTYNDLPRPDLQDLSLSLSMVRLVLYHDPIHSQLVQEYEGEAPDN